MAKLDDRITRLRIFGPVYLDKQGHWLQSLCFWCRTPVQIQAFVPEVQPEAPENGFVGDQKQARI